MLVSPNFYPILLAYVPSPYLIGNVKIISQDFNRLCKEFSFDLFMTESYSARNQLNANFLKGPQVAPMLFFFRYFIHIFCVCRCWSQNINFFLYCYPKEPVALCYVYHCCYLSSAVDSPYNKLINNLYKLLVDCLDDLVLANATAEQGFLGSIPELDKVLLGFSSRDFLITVTESGFVPS